MFKTFINVIRARALKGSPAILIIAVSFAISACGSNFEWFPDPVDDKIPTVSASISSQAIFNNRTTTVSTLPATVMFTASEPTVVYYTTNGDTPSTGSASVDVSNSAVGPVISVTNTILKFFGIDKSAEKNKSTVTTATIKTADSSAPVIGATISGQIITNGQTTLVNALPASVLFTASEPATIYYTTNGAEPTTGSPSVAVVSSSTPVTGPLITVTNTILKYFGIDSVQNVAATQTATIRLTTPTDTTPATFNADIRTTDGTTPITSLNTHINSLPGNVFFSGASEPAIIYYTIDGSEPTTTSASVSLAPGELIRGPTVTSSNTVVRFYSVDNAGNPSTKIITTILSP